MAKASPEDPHQGLADPALLARDIADLDLFDASEISSARLRDDALAMEEAARAVAGVTNSAGASASAGMGGLVLATSHGFVGQYVATRFSRSVSALAGEGTAMERDHDFSSRLHFSDLAATDFIGRRAGERAGRSRSCSTRAWLAPSPATSPARSTARPSPARPASCATAWARGSPRPQSPSPTSR
jgi:PmbA protein